MAKTIKKTVASANTSLEHENLEESMRKVNMYLDQYVLLVYKNNWIHNFNFYFENLELTVHFPNNNNDDKHNVELQRADPGTKVTR